MAVTTESARASVTELYIAAFNRVPDTAGLAYWTNLVVNGTLTVDQVAQTFTGTPEYQAKYPTFLTNGEYVDKIYLNVFGRAADPGGKAFWTATLDNKQLTWGTIMEEMLKSAHLDPTNPDGIRLTNQATFGVWVNMNGYDQAVATPYLTAITDDPATLTTAESNVTRAGGKTYYFTTNIDNLVGTTADDIFDASVNTAGTATFNSADTADGGGGNDILTAQLNGGTLSTTLKNIEDVRFITSAASTFDMVNSTGITTLKLQNASAALTVNNIGSASQGISIQDEAADVNLNYTNAALVGASSVTLNLSGAQSDNSGGADIAIAQAAGADSSGVETLTIVSGGSGQNFLDSVTAVNPAGAAAGTVATLNVSGTQGLMVATAFSTSVRTIDASGLTGATGLSAGFGATTAVTVTGSGAADTLTFASNAGDSSISAGAGNDIISLAGFTSADTVNAGDGVDRLDISAANAEAVTSALTNTTNFEQLSLNTAATSGSSINATRFGAIDTVRLDKGTAGAYGVTMAAGTQNLTIAEPTAGTDAILAGTLTVTDTGTAATDVINITNRDTDTTSATNNFSGAAITSAGYETVNINTGSAVTAAQTIGVITITGDSTSTAQTIALSGANALTLNDGPVSNSSALFTINASGMTAQAAGTATFTMASGPTFAGVTGTVSIVGSAGQDVLLGHASAANTIDGGAGVDTVTGGTAADSLLGGAGNDSITGGGGNDTVFGNDGNDTITMTTGTVSVDGGAGNDTVVMAATLTAGDVVVGGEGNDTLTYSGAALTAAAVSGVSGFETLTWDATSGQTQDLVQFINNSTFTRVNFAATDTTATFSNAGAGIATLGLGNSDFTSGTFTRLVDTSTDTLTVNASGMNSDWTVGALSIANEETVTLSTATSGAGDLTITTLTADDLTSLTITGASDVVVGTLANAANLATLNAVAATGTINLVASSSVANLTATGSLSAANTITGGTGADTIIGGDAADSLTGGNGADSISGGGGADSLLGEIGNDTLVGGIGDDTITGGAGNDSITFGEGADDAVFAAKGSNGVDSIADFVTTVDDIDVTTDISGAAVTITTAGATQTLVDNTEYYISTNGAAANFFTGGTATLNVADLTATTLTNLATYLNERFVGTNTAGDVAIFTINWTAGGNTTTYVYEYLDGGGTTAVIASEIELTGIVTHAAGAILVDGDII